MTKLTLEQRIDALEERQNSTWITSPRFFKRALAVWGHAIAGYMVVALPIVILIIILGGKA